MKAFVTLLTLLISAGAICAQGRFEVRGVLHDSTGTGVSGATVKLTSTTDTLLAKTGDQGTFILRGVTSLRFLLTISNLGYQTIEKEYELDGGQFLVFLDPLRFEPQTYELDQISILARRAVVIKKDTIEYRARHFKVRENAFTIDLLKKLPGITFDREGALIAQGKVITRVKVNGKDFFGGDVETAIRNIPANLIEKIQVIDDYGDKARLTGDPDGRYQKIINIKTWANLRKGYFGNATAGKGDEGRYQLSAMGNYFNNNRETAFYGNLNNNNASIPGSAYALAGSDRGLNTITATGFNYREKYNKNLSSYGSYNFAKNINKLFSETFRQNIYPDNTFILNNDTTTNKTISYNHVMQWTVEYEDSVNFFQVAPVLNLNRKDMDGSSVLRQNKQIYNFLTDGLHQISREHQYSYVPTVSGRVVANHKFGKTGRNLYGELTVRDGWTTTEQDVTALMLFYDNQGRLNQDSVQRQFMRNENESFGTTVQISYIEPISDKSRVEVGYIFGYSSYLNDRQTRLDWRRKVDSLNNRYNYSFTTNTVNISYRYNGTRHSYTVGLSVQPTLLSGQSISRNIDINRRGLNVVPDFNYSYLISAERSFSVNYAATSNPPTYLQLQPVTDVSNPQYPVTGNPTLKSELWHNFDINYSSFSAGSGKTFFASLNGAFIQDQVVSNTVLITREDNIVSQETLFKNVNGNFILGGVYNLSLPTEDRKYIVDLNGSVNYNHGVSMSNFERISSRNLIISQAVRMQVNPSDKLEFYPSVVYTFNRNRYSLEEYSNKKLSTWGLGAGGRFNITPSLLIGLEADKNFNRGFTGAGRTNPFILNSFIEKQFLKNRRGALRFSGFDLFNQNTSVRRTVQSNAILDNRSNRLGRYFMLLFKLNLNKFEA